MSDFNYHQALSPCKSECNLRGILPAAEKADGFDDTSFCTSCGRTRGEIAGWGQLSEEGCLEILKKLANRKKGVFN